MESKVVAASPTDLSDTIAAPRRIGHPPAPMPPIELHAQVLVRDVLMHLPGAPRAFERHRVDYCCHGALPLSEASARVGANVDAVIASLHEEAARPDAEPAWGDAWETMPLEDVVRHLRVEVHPGARRGVDALRKRARELGDDDAPLARAILTLCDELGAHLDFEERHVFPYIVELEQTGEAPPALFDSIAEPARMLVHEHEASDRVLDTLRTLTHGYEAPTGASDATRTLYAALAEYDKALVRHMHLEGNVLLPRAQQLEVKTRPPTRRR